MDGLGADVIVMASRAFGAVSHGRFSLRWLRIGGPTHPQLLRCLAVAGRSCSGSAEPWGDPMLFPKLNIGFWGRRDFLRA